MHAPQRAREFVRHPVERHAERRAPSDQHVIVPGRRPGRGSASRTTSRSRRRTRLRSTALPTFLVTVKPNARRPSSSRWRACSTNAAAGTLRSASPRPGSPPVASTVPWKRATGCVPPSGGQPLAPARAPRDEHLAAALGGHAGAESVTALAHQLARLIGPLHVSILRWSRRDGEGPRQHRPPKSP